MLKQFCERFNFLFLVSSFRKMSSTSKPRIYITREIPKEALSILEKHCLIEQWPESEKAVIKSELLNKVKTIDGLYCLLTDQIDKEVLNEAKNLKIISTMSVGYDHIDINECKRRKIRIGYTPEVLTEAVADLNVTLLLTVSRRIIEATEAVKDGQWGTWSPLWMCGRGLQNATVGFFGFGRIANAVSKRLLGFGVKEIIYTSKSDKNNAFRYVDFEELLQLSDYLLITCSLNKDTKSIFNETAFSKMKPTSILINTSRGDVLNQDDLIMALKNKTIAAAGLDVTIPEPLSTDSELLKLNNCIVLPHIGSATLPTRVDMGILAAENLINGLFGKEMVEVL